MSEYYGSAEQGGGGRRKILKYMKILIYLNDAIHFHVLEMYYLAYALP